MTYKYLSFARRLSQGLAADLLAHQRSARGKRLELAERDGAIERYHAAVGARVELFRRHELHRGADRGRDLLRSLDLIGGDIDRARQHVLALEQAEQLERHLRVRAFERHLVDLRPGEQRESRLVLPPL